MNQFRVCFAFLAVILFSIQLLAGPKTNLAEIEGDALLSREQQEEYTQRLERGLEFFDKADYASAEKEFNAILAFAPKKALAYFNLGLTKYKMKDYPGAIQNFDRVIKMKSYYVGAAFYYKAIAQLNLGDSEGATKTASRFTEARFYYDLSQDLLKSISAGHDEYLQNAEAAYVDGNFELCLLELERSVYGDAPKGIALNEKCKQSLAQEPKEEQAPAPLEEKPYRTEFYLDSRVFNSDNIYQTAKNTKSNGGYSLYTNGQILWSAPVEVGLGAKYEHFNAFNLDSFKDETIGAFIPFVFKNNNHRVFADISYDASKFEGKASFNDTGGSLTYFYLLSNYSTGFTYSDHSKKSDDTIFDYRAGRYQAFRVMLTRYDGRFSSNVTVGLEDNNSNDQNWGTFILPNANKAKKVSARLSYNLTDKSELSLRGLFAEYNFRNTYSVRNVAREDRFTNLTLRYSYKWNSVLATYVSATANKNDSNYDDTEGVNKNFTENLASLGLTLSSY